MVNRPDHQETRLRGSPSCYALVVTSLRTNLSFGTVRSTWSLLIFEKTSISIDGSEGVGESPGQENIEVMDGMAIPNVFIAKKSDD